MIGFRALRQSLAALFILSVGWTLPAAHAQADATSFVDGLAQRAIPVLTDQSLPQSQREQNFRQLLHEGFDMQQIGRLVLGRYWREASEPERAEFVKLLEDYLVRLYAERFTDFQNVSLQIAGARPEQDGTLVQSVLQRPNGQPVALDWRVERTGNRFVITDLVVEGVSMVITQRSEFASVIRQKGGEIGGLLDVLRQKTQG